MRKIFLILFLCISSIGAYAKLTKVDLNEKAPKDWKEPARYVKLGATYRESGDVEKAIDVLNNKALKPLKALQSKGDGSESKYIKYYLAAAKENLGYCYLVLNQNEVAREYLKDAMNTYLWIKDLELKIDLEPLRVIIARLDGEIEDEPEIALSDFIPPSSGECDRLNPEQFKSKAQTGAIVPQTNTRTSSLKNKTLSLEDQKLTEIPANTDNRFTKISLINNKFNGIGNILSYFPKAQDLYLDGNPITNLPENIGDYRSLKVLSLTDTKIKELPNSIGELRNLERLVLSNTKIAKLPPNIVKLTNLRLLDLRNTPKLSFAEIKKAIQSLPNTVIMHDRYIREPEPASEDEE